MQLVCWSSGAGSTYRSTSAAGAELLQTAASDSVICCDPRINTDLLHFAFFHADSVLPLRLKSEVFNDDTQDGRTLAGVSCLQ